MIPTIAWISRKFDQFNKEYFNSILLRPKFEISSTRSAWGHCCWDWKEGTGKKILVGRRYKIYPDYKEGSAKIRISKFFDVAEHDIEETLIHEMIHLYFVQKNMCWVNHGTEFKRIARQITSQGRHQINTTDNYKCSVNPEIANKKRKNYQVFIIREKYGPKRYLYIYGKEEHALQNKKAVEHWLSYSKFKNSYEYVEMFISDHDMFVGRRSSIKYTTNRATAYFFSSVTQYLDVVKTAKYLVKAA